MKESEIEKHLIDIQQGIETICDDLLPMRCQVGALMLKAAGFDSDEQLFRYPNLPVELKAIVRKCREDSDYSFGTGQLADEYESRFGPIEEEKP